MPNISSIRAVPILTGFLLVSAVSLAAQTPALPAQEPQVKPSAVVTKLPATQPTGGSAQPEVVHTAAAPHHVAVEYTDGKLAIQATNASLNEVLREVSHKTGMKITGGVSDDRVFGTYGPSTPPVVLDALLEGADSNILLVDDKNGGSELILTPRRGGVTPPNPNAAQASEPEDSTAAGYYVPPVVPFQAPVANGRGPGAGPDPQQGAATASEDADTAAPKTPQQIYEQLQKAMQQRQLNTVLPQ